MFFYETSAGAQKEQDPLGPPEIEEQSRAWCPEPFPSPVVSVNCPCRDRRQT